MMYFSWKRFSIAVIPRRRSSLRSLGVESSGRFAPSKRASALTPKRVPKGRILNQELGRRRDSRRRLLPALDGEESRGRRPRQKLRRPRSKWKPAGTVGKKTRVDEYADALLTLSGGDRGTRGHGSPPCREKTIFTSSERGDRSMFPFPGCRRERKENGRSKCRLRERGRERLVKGRSEAMFAIEVDCVAANLENREAPTMTLEDFSGQHVRLGPVETRDRDGLRYRKINLPTAHRPRKAPAAPIRDHDDLRTRRRHRQAGFPSRDGEGITSQNLPHASVMFDDFYERGGNCFDVAWVYGRGEREKLLGQWIDNRGVREELLRHHQGGPPASQFSRTRHAAVDGES